MKHKIADLDAPAARPPLDLQLLVRRTSGLLAAGVPLTLLIDLGDADGPHSAQRYAAEGGSADWLCR
ncbi:MAG: hypothetical protein EPN99_00475 [Frankiales bacterium]|nr:MAG: hypothetical protein EPN99_00475 [Frankiales bacterium]